MRRSYALLIAILIIGVLTSGCLSTTGSAQSPSSIEDTSSISHHSPSKQAGTETSPAAARVKTAEINGTFSGYLTAPLTVFEEVERFLEGINATLYTFEVEIIGENFNTSVTLYALKLVPPFVPHDFNVTVNAHPVNGTVFISYARKIPVSIEAGGIGTTSYLEVQPQAVLKASGALDKAELNNLNGSTILTLGETRGELRLILRLANSGSYTFIVLHNGTEITSARMEVDG
ncbi:hypothetical protein [Thermococcus sp.]|uniref:hypothetical protein n=1 Tax=Thermococcus sp. TaxID=35749 RepID=UPI0026033208|nr:hypothetical protein [Thermococcus sp.]